MSMGIYAEFAAKYHESGYNVIPLKGGEKRPFLNEWTKFCHSPIDPMQLDSWIDQWPNANIGICLGSASNVIGIDFDHDVDGLQEQLQALIPPSPVRKVGQKGFTAFYRYNGEPPKKWAKDGKMVIELLSTGNQTVLPPSIHPDTHQPYKWLSEDNLLDIDAKDLPRLPEDIIQQIDRVMGYDHTPQRKPSMTGLKNPLEIDVREIEEILGFIPSHEYSVWLHIGMALHKDLGDKGMDIWDAWSRKASNYHAQAINDKWRSFGRYNGNNIGIGTIYHYGTTYGWINPHHEELFPHGLPDIKVSPVASSAAPVPIDQLSFPRELLDAPNLIGRIMRWIDSTAIRRQPILSLAASICAVGTIMGHRFRSETNLRTNFMCLGIAESASGKEHARSCIDSLYRYCGLEHYILGEFGSEPGVLTAVHRNNGIGFALMDEIGRELKTLASNRTGGHEMRILTTLMKLWSNAGSTYRGKEYVNHDGSMNRKDIVQPCLSIYGTTVPKRLYDSLTSDEAVDGFLARWLLFVSDDISPALQAGGDIYTPPQNIIDEIKEIQERPVYAPQTDVKNINPSPQPSPMVIPFTSEAKDVLDNFGRYVDEERIKSIKSANNCAPLWGRAREHAIKLALVAHEVNCGVIDATVMKWAVDLITHTTMLAAHVVTTNVSDTQHEAILKRVSNIINQHYKINQKGIRHRQLVRATQYIDNRTRTSILQQLAESGTVAATTEECSGGRYTYVYSPCNVNDAD